MTSEGEWHEFPDDASTIWYLMRRISSLMDRQGDALIRQELGVSLAQFLVLSVVDAYPGPLSQQAIADRLALTKGTVSRQIDQAVAAGLMTVTTAAHTRRENSVQLTETGTALVRRGDVVARVSQQALLDSIPNDDVAACIRGLTGILAGLESDRR